MGCGCLGVWLTWWSYCSLDALPRTATWAFSVEKHWLCSGRRSRAKLTAELDPLRVWFRHSLMSDHNSFTLKELHIISSVNYHTSNWWNVLGWSSVFVTWPANWKGFWKWMNNVFSPKKTFEIMIWKEKMKKAIFPCVCRGYFKYLRLTIKKNRVLYGCSSTFSEAKAFYLSD